MGVRVTGKAVCTKCNSVTLYFDNGAINSMARIIIYPSIKKDAQKIMQLNYNQNNFKISCRYEILIVPLYSQKHY